MLSLLTDVQKNNVVSFAHANAGLYQIVHWEISRDNKAVSLAYKAFPTSINVKNMITKD